MLFDQATLAPRPRRPLLAVSVALHLAAAAALLALPHHRAKTAPREVAVVFIPPPRLPPAERPLPASARKLLAQRRAGLRALPLAVRPPPERLARSVPPPQMRVRREPAPPLEPRPVVMQGLTIQSTARALNEVRPSSGGGELAGERGSGPAPAGAAGVGRLVDAGEVTDPPAVVARAELRRFYPAEAMKNGFEGDVKLRLLIAQDGTLARVDVLHDPGEGLGAAGALAIRSYRFRPARVNGEPVATSIHFTLHFLLG